MRRTFDCRRPPIYPSGCLRPPGASFRRFNIGGWRRDLSAEIIEIEPSFQPDQACEKSLVLPIPQSATDGADAGDGGMFCEAGFHLHAFLGYETLGLWPALSYEWPVFNSPDDLAAVRACPPAATKLSQNQLRSFRTDCGMALAWANIAVPVCTRMLYLAY